MKNTTEKERISDREQARREQLSEHFTLWELTRSATAIDLNIKNQPGPTEVEALKQLCIHVLEPLRRRFGRILITSGYRCKRVNEAVGGAIYSQHCRGEAADIYIANIEMACKYFKFIQEETDFDQLIWEPRGAEEARWLHVSYTTRRKNRKMVLL